LLNYFTAGRASNFQHCRVTFHTTPWACYCTTLVGRVAVLHYTYRHMTLYDFSSRQHSPSFDWIWGHWTGRVLNPMCGVSSYGCITLTNRSSTSCALDVTPTMQLALVGLSDVDIFEHVW